jgi:lysophospholipase L1-like esterase
MKKNVKTTHRMKLLLIVCSFVILSGALLFAEALVWIFLDIPLLGLSPHLITAKAYGSSKGNTRNAAEISFGLRVNTDEYGFRIAKGDKRDGSVDQNATLILGDSVGFGPGVEVDKTFAGIIARSHPSLRIYNSSVIGYNTYDYKNIVDYFLPFHQEIRHVFLVFCLNDISSVSAVNIDQSLELNKKNHSRHIDFFSMIHNLKKLHWLQQVNDFLGCRSKLYVLIRGLLTDPQRRYWEADYRMYKNAHPDTIALNFNPIVSIKRTLSDQHIRFTVIIAPYEFQLRKNTEALRMPQQKVADFLIKNHIEYIDSMPIFLEKNMPSHTFFLSYDPMHFSEEGHKVIAEIIERNIQYSP